MTKAERIELKLRLRRFREAVPLPLWKVSKACGLKSPQAVAAWEDPKKPNLPKAHHYPKLAELYGVHVNDLHGTVEHLLKGDSVNDEFAGAGRTVPSVDWDDIDAFRDNRVMAKAKVRTSFPAGPRAFHTFIRNNENSPALLRGDAVIIDPDMKPAPGELCLAWNGNVLSIGRYRPRGALIEVAPINEDWPTFTVKPDAIVGFVTERTHRMRTSD